MTRQCDGSVSLLFAPILQWLTPGRLHSFCLCPAGVSPHCEVSFMWRNLEDEYKMIWKQKLNRLCRRRGIYLGTVTDTALEGTVCDLNVNKGFSTHSLLKWLTALLTHIKRLNVSKCLKQDIFLNYAQLRSSSINLWCIWLELKIGTDLQ